MIDIMQEMIILPVNILNATDRLQNTAGSKQ
jgi:hypothetical protein